MTALAPTLQAFFTERLIRQRQASPHTLAAYRDTLRLLLVFASARKDVEPSKLDIDDLDAPLIGAFLDHLEKQRENSARTRNARLAAVRSLFRYAALRHPEHAAIIERVLAIPRKRFDRRLVTFLIEPELDALFRAPDRSTWTGRRDHTLLTLAAQTGLRASELIGLRISDVHLGTGAHVSCMGKGRKLRITPITSGMVGLLRVWLAERAGQPTEPLFVTQSGTSLSRDAVEHRLAKYIQIATRVIYTYSHMFRRPPAETDMQRHFQVSPPSVHQMIVTLDRNGLIRRQPGVARSIQVLVAPKDLPILDWLKINQS